MRSSLGVLATAANWSGEWKGKGNSSRQCGMRSGQAQAKCDTFSDEQGA